jgi:hypothetical protein
MQGSILFLFPVERQNLFLQSETAKRNKVEEENHILFPLSHRSSRH